MSDITEWLHGGPLMEAARLEIESLRAELEAAREKQRMLTDHAVRVDTEAFRGNVAALSKLDIDAMDAQPLLLAVQNWDISTGRARELLRCWVLGTFKPDMLPECGDDLFSDTEEPREAWSRLRAENFALAAGQCPNVIGDEGGTPRCKEIDRLRAINAELLAALREAEAGLEFAGADKHPAGDFVPAPTAALRIVRTAIAKATGAKQ